MTNANDDLYAAARNPANPYRVQATNPDGTKGMVSPFVLRLATREEADRIAARYNAGAQNGTTYAAVEVVPEGYIVPVKTTFTAPADSVVLYQFDPLLPAVEVTYEGPYMARGAFEDEHVIIRNGTPVAVLGHALRLPGTAPAAVSATSQDLLALPAGVIYPRHSRVMPRHAGDYMVRHDRVKFGTSEMEHGGWTVGSLSALRGHGHKMAGEG